MEKIKSKKAESLAIGKLIGLIIAIAILILAFMTFFNPKILNWIKGLPGSEPPTDSTKVLTPDEMRLLDYEKIGKVELGKNENTRNRQYYVWILEKNKYTQSECELVANKEKGYTWKLACYDSYGFLSDNINDLKCQKYKEDFGQACFDENNFLAYNEKWILTPLYWDWDITDSYNGAIRYSEFLWDTKIGEIKNNFFILDPETYNSYRLKLNQLGINQETMNKLNGSRYVGGGLYRYRNKILENTKALNWQNTLNEYNKIKCNVNPSTCEIDKEGCACFKSQTLVDQTTFELCSQNKKYCYNAVAGCQDYGPSTVAGIEACNKSLGSNFIQTPDCQIDTESKVLNSPCSCPTATQLANINKGIIVAIETCSSNQYCFKGKNGCSDTKY
jgi:hypothetical protein